MEFLLNRGSNIHRPSPEMPLKERNEGMWSYHPEHPQSHLISTAKQGWAWLVLGREKKNKVGLNPQQQRGQDEKTQKAELGK